MRHFTPIALAILAIAGAARASEPVLAHSWDEAVTLSKQHGTPILIDFFTEW